MADSLRRLDTIVSQQLPDFIRSEYPTFVTFLEKFYEWSSTTGPIAAAYRLPDSQDIDATDEELLVHFKNEFLVHVPDKILVDKRFLVKHIREFYRAKSTEDSYRFLFRVLFGTDLDFYYPRTNILVPSSGVWQQDKTLRVFPVVGNPTDLINKKLIGTDSGASGLVEDVLHMLVGGFNFYELFFSSTSIEGTFLASEDVASEAGDIIAVALPCVTSITLTNKGTGYIEGQKITFSGSSGSGALANIGRVGSAGEILSIKMIDPGVGYFDVPTLSFPDNGSGTDAQGEALVTAQITYPGYYIGERSFLSASDKLQDSYYYQQFSYVLKSSESTQSYKEAVKNLVHPAGLKMFGSLLDIQQFSNTKIKIFDAVISGIAESILTKLLIFSEMLSGGVSLGQGKLTLSHTIKESSTSFLLGPCLRSLDRDAFKYLPNEDNWLDPANIEGVNAGYWDEFPNTPISVFSDYTFDDFLNTPYRKIALCPDAIIYIHVAASPELENDVLLPCPQIVLFGRDPNTFGSEDPDNLVYLSIASIASSGEIPGTTHTENNFITSPSLSTSISGQTPQIVAPNNSFVSIPLGTVSSSAKTPGTTYTQNNFITLAQGSVSIIGQAPQANCQQNNFITLPTTSIATSVKTPEATSTTGEYVLVPVSNRIITVQEPSFVVPINMFVQLPQASIASSGKTPTIDSSAWQYVTLPQASIVSSAKIPGTTYTENNFVTAPQASVSSSPKEPSWTAPANNFVTMPTVSITSSVKTPGTTYTENNFVTAPQASVVAAGQAPQSSVPNNNFVTAPQASVVAAGQAPQANCQQNNFITMPLATITASGQAPQTSAPNNSYVTLAQGSIASSGKIPGTTYTQNNFITLAQGSIASSGKTPQATTHEELTTWTVSSNLIYKNGSLFIPSGYYHIGDRTGRDATDIYDMVNYGANTICTRIEQSTADLAFLDTCHGLGIYVMVEMDSEPLDLIAATKDHPAVMGYLAGFTADPYTQFDDVDSKGVSTTDVQTYCDIIKAAAPTKLTYMTGFTVSTPSTWDDYVGYSDVYAKYNYPDAWTAPDSIEWALSLDYAAINAVTDCAFTTCHGQFLSGNIPTALQVRNGFWQQIFRTVVGNIVYAYYDGSNNLRSETGIKTEFQSLFSEISAISAYLGSGTLTPRTTNRSLVWSFTWTKSGQSDLLVVINTNNASKSMNYSCGISGTSLSKKWSRYSSGLSISGSTITGTIASLDTHVYIINH